MIYLRKKFVVGALTTLAVVAAAGCSSADNEDLSAKQLRTLNSDEKCTQDLAGGDLTMATSLATQTLDPVTSNSGANGGSERAAIYDTLVKYDVETNEYKPHLAESLEGNEGSTQWTLKLREGIKFANGEPLTSEVVQTSMKRHMDPGAGSNIYDLMNNIESMDLVDDLTLVFNLSRPNGTFPFTLAGSGGEITNPTVVKELGEDFGLKTASGMGLGPYDVVRFAPGEEVVMKAKSDYWGGPVCIDQLRFINITGGKGTYEAFKLDEVQVAYLKDARSVNDAKEDGAQGYSGYSYAGAEVLMNNGVRDSTPATKDQRIREAVALAIDPEVMNKRRWDGLGNVSSSLIAPATEALFPGIEGPPYDPEKSKELVAEAKEDGWDGKLTLVCPDDPSNVEASIAIQALLDAVGIEVDASQVATNDLINSVIIDANYELACWGVGAQVSSPYIAFGTFHSEALDNYAGFKNSEMDAAIDKLEAAATIEAQREALGEIQTVWNETIPSAIYGSPESVIVVSDAVHGVKPTSWSTLLFHDAYID